MNYGTRLDQALTAAKKTRRQLATALGCTPQTIGVVINWTGDVERKLSTDYHRAAADYLRINPDWLLTGSGEMRQSLAAPKDAAPSFEGKQLAELFDMLPADRLTRVRAYQACTQILLEALQPHEPQPIEKQAPPVMAKKQPA